MAVRPLGFSLAALTLLAVALPAALPAAPYLVKDLHTSPQINYAKIDLTDRGIGVGVSYFAAADPAHGAELWRSDGTPGGTERLTDICAGPCSSLPAATAVHAGRVFFRANDGFSGDELWVSEGTPGSERRVRALCPGLCSAYPSLVVAAGDRLLFFSYFSGGLELWRTDGTREGTVRVSAFCATECYVSDPTSFGGKALFLVNGLDLWVTDGTAAGTLFLRRLGFESSHLAFFPRLIPGDGFAWVWDADGLWRTDGTAAGTVLLADMDELATRPDYSRDLSSRAIWHGQLFGVVGPGDVIRSDGTPEGTFRIASAPDGSYVGSLAPLDGEVLFPVSDASDHGVLWSTRGTVDTTGPRLDLETAEAPSSLTHLSGGRAVFLAEPDRLFENARLWVTDGTMAGTRALAVPSGFRLVGSAGAGRLGGKLVFSAMASDFAALLFVSDGTAAGTGLVTDLNPGPGSSSPHF
jgi:ELWxxDGT repeat protein